MRIARLLIIVALAGLCPATAHAGARSFWAWLEELSGPGPFRGDGPVLSVPIGCVRDDGARVKDCWSKTTHIRQLFAVRFASFTSEEGAVRFKDLPAEDTDNTAPVHLKAVSFLYLFRVHPAIDMGSGIGFMHLSGSGFDGFNKLTITPASVSVSPFALVSAWSDNRFAYLVRVEVDTSFVPQGFKGSDFGNTRTSFDSGPEFLTRAAFVIDLSVLIRP